MTAFNFKNVPLASAVLGALAAGGTQPVMAQQLSQATSSAQAPVIKEGPLSITFGGFAELTTIYRNKNEVSDVASDFNAGIPFAYQPQSTQPEYRMSARQSRFSMLVESPNYRGKKGELYLETDFLSAGDTSNSRESNSYTLRLRNFYGRIVSTSGWDVLGGQNWSLVTLGKKGMTPRDEDIPQTIDAQYVAGFNWTRNAQLRLVDHLNRWFSVGLSIESPQAVTAGGNTLTGTGGSYPANAVVTNSGDGAGLLNTTTTYSIDTRPDVVLKVAADPGFGHYEAYGLARWFSSNVAGITETKSGGGLGFGMSLPFARDKLSVRVSGLIGKGIGRYGSAQLPDIAERPDGSVQPINAYQFLVGLTLTPNSYNTLYLYGGRERAEATAFTVGTAGFGYGSILANNTGCELATGTAATCQGNTHQIEEVTTGYWYKFYQGALGNAQIGVQAAYLQRDLFAGVGGAPSSNILIGMVSFRYYPYQR